MASTKRGQTSSTTPSNKKTKKDADSQEGPTDFEMELAMLDDDMGIEFSQESEGLYLLVN